MKKILLIAFCASMFAASTSNAQNLKQSGGEKNLQVMFAPLGGSPIGIDGIAYRKFNATGNRAWRVNVFIGLSNETEVVGQPVDTGSFATGGGVPEADKKTSGMTFSLRPGYEWHHAGTERLSPYGGIELLFSMTTAKVETDTVVDNGTSSAVATDYVVLTKEQKGKGASTSFGLNLVAGADYYIAKNLSLGAELGFGFSMTSHPDIESEGFNVNSTSGAWELKENPLQKQGSSMQVGPNVVGKIKLGWLF